MIAATSLRIGNKVYETGNLSKQFSVSAKTILRAESGSIKLSGISLSPYILEQCGFTKDGHDDAVWYQKEFPFIGELCTSDREHPLGNYLFDTNTDKLRIHYLHQLQNLFYALTGEELTFNQ